MKKFWTQIAIFFLPFLLVPIVEAFMLPVSFFSYRSWEALRFSKSELRLSEFYPDFKLTAREEGDLAHHSSKAIKKDAVWITDRLGNRNTQFISEPDVLLIGDSFFAGTGLSQEETITGQLQKLWGNQVKVYNITTSSFSDFDRLYKEGVLKKPKLIVYSIVERNIPSVMKTYRENALNRGYRKFITLGNLNVKLDRLLRLYSLEWARARVNNRTGLGKPSPINPNMFFFEGSSVHRHSDEELSRSLNAIVSYQQYCDALGIDFLFVPMPNKETVYFEWVSFDHQPDYLLRLEDNLKKKEIATVNTLGIYNQERQKSNALLYHYDDTHWNAVATARIAKEIAVHYPF